MEKLFKKIDKFLSPL